MVALKSIIKYLILISVELLSREGMQNRPQLVQYFTLAKLLACGLENKSQFYELLASHGKERYRFKKINK